MKQLLVLLSIIIYAFALRFILNTLVSDKYIGLVSVIGACIIQMVIVFIKISNKPFIISDKEAKRQLNEK